MQLYANPFTNVDRKVAGQVNLSFSKILPLFSVLKFGFCKGVF